MSGLAKQVKQSKQPGKLSWRSVFDKDRIWEKDDLLDVIYWARQVLAIVMGLVWGILGLKGLFAIALFIILNSIAVYAYTNWLEFEFDADDSFAGIKEGFSTTCATFFVCWIVIYTLVHHS